MNTWVRWIAVGLVSLMLASCRSGAAPAEATERRLVVLGGTLTEVVYALGEGAAVVGADASATYPPAVANVPKVGFYRALSAEGVLGLSPTLVLASDETGPPPVVQQIKATGLAYHAFANPRHLDSTRALIRQVGTLLDRQAAADSLLQAFDREASSLQAFLAQHPAQPRVLFVYARGTGTVQVAGTNTSADAILTAAGCVNAVSGFAGYKPLTPEAVLEANPDYLLFTTNGLQGLGGKEGLANYPGISQAEAFRRGRILVMDDLYLLGFGPRAPQAALELARATRPTL